jgi:hypothetical protein
MGVSSTSLPTGGTMSKPKIPDLCGELLASLKVPRLEDENAALTKRVAELEEQARARDELKLHSRTVLENQVANLRSENKALRSKASVTSELTEADKLRTIVANLQSQLAWTPVAQGLPTEREQDTWLLLCAESGSPANPLECCRPWEAPTLIKDNARSGRVFTHFRRITLPEAT